MAEQQNEMPLAIQLGAREFQFANVILCPRCGFSYSIFERPTIQPGNDNYDADWPGRGDLLVIPFEGECGHRFEVCFGFHKGVTHAFIRPTQNRRRAPLRNMQPRLKV